MNHRLLIGTVIVGLLHVANADVVRLKDGRQLIGDVKKSAEGWTITDESGKSTSVTADQVLGLELGNAPAPQEDQSQLRFGSLKRAIDAGNDPKAAIERYHKYIEQYKTDPSAELARKEIPAWQDRIDRHLVKWGNDWLTPEAMEQIQQRSFTRAEEARQLLKNNRLKEADAILAQALSDDPSNPTALYLRGVVSYRMDQLGVAKKSFETVAQMLKDHAPSQNNAGVVLFRQKRFPEALRAFNDAMNSSPKNKDILSNVAEVLNAMPDRDRTGDAYERANRRFTEQEKMLSQDLVGSGWVRWGSTWVTQAEADRLGAIEKEIRKKLDALSAEFDATQTAINKIDRDIESTQRSMRQLEASTYQRDVNGNLIRLPYPATYYQLQDDLSRLETDRKSLLPRLDKLRDSAAATQKQMPTPRFSGAMHLIDVEGAPMVKLMPVSLPAAEATTQPASPALPTTQPAPPTTQAAPTTQAVPATQAVD